MDNKEKLLDDAGWQILSILQQEGRIPFNELGKRVNLSPPAAAERVRRLEEAKVIIRYRAELDLEKLGLPITAFMNIKTFGHNCQEIRSVFHERPEVISCYRVTGKDHYLLKVSVSSVSHLEQLVDRFIPYATVATSIVLSTPVAERTIDNDIFKV